MMSRGPFGRVLGVATVCLAPLAATAADMPPLVVQSCGKPIPMELGDPVKFKDQGIDIGQFRRNEAASYLKLFETICKDAKYRDLAEQNVTRILAVSESGAILPTAYLDGTTLVIEFAGGKFDTGQATEELRRAIAGLPPDDAD